MKRYVIWNKEDDIFTPSGECLTASQWIERFPIAGVPSVAVVCGAGAVNGSIFGILSEMVDKYERQGCDFSNCNTDEEKLDAIEAFMDARDAEARVAAENTVENENITAMSLASIAASLEYQNMLTLDDVEV